MQKGYVILATLARRAQHSKEMFMLDKATG